MSEGDVTGERGGLPGNREEQLQRVASPQEVSADGYAQRDVQYPRGGRRAGRPRRWRRPAEVFAAGARAIEEVNASPRGLRASQFDITSLRDEDPEGYTGDVDWLLEQVEAGRLAPAVRAVALGEAAEAHRELDAGRVTGRIVLDHRL